MLNLKRVEDWREGRENVTRPGSGKEKAMVKGGNEAVV